MGLRFSFFVSTRMHSSRMRTARSLPYGWGSLSRVVSVQGVSVQGSLCPRGSLSKAVSVQGVSVQRVNPITRKFGIVNFGTRYDIKNTCSGMGAPTQRYYVDPKTAYWNIKEWKNSTCWLVLVVCKIMVFSPFKLKVTSNIWMPLKCTLEMGIAPQNMP